MTDTLVEYGRVKLEDICVRIANGKAEEEPTVECVEINDESLRPSTRFWNSFFSHFGISSSIFRYYSHAEVFSRIAKRSKDSTIRYCVDRRRGRRGARLLAITRPGKPLITYTATMQLLQKHRVSDYHFDRNGIVTSEHVPLSGDRWHTIGSDRFAHRYRLRVPIDGFGRPRIHLMVFREVCSNGLVGFAPAFRSELAGGDNIAFTVDRALASFDNGDGYSALKQRLEMAQKSWASVHEANKLYRVISSLRGSGDIREADVLTQFHGVTGDISKLYGIASADCLSAKQQETLPCDCRVMDLLNFASELGTHHASPSGGEKLDVYCGSLLSRLYDLEGTAENVTSFADFFGDRPSQN